MKNGKYVQPGYNERGEEIPDPTPIEVPVDFRAPPSLVDEIKRYVRAELSARADAAGEETFEEADDFWVDDDEHLSSEYELTDMQEEFILHPERFSRKVDLDQGKLHGKEYDPSVAQGELLDKGDSHGSGKDGSVDSSGVRIRKGGDGDASQKSGSEGGREDGKP